MSFDVLVATLVLALTLVLLIWFDLRSRRLPNALTLALLVFGIAFHLWTGPSFLTNAILGTVLGFLLIWLVGELYKHLRHKQGLGLGDAKLLAAGGAWVGWQGLPSVLLIASLSGLAVILIFRLTSNTFKDPTYRWPFGPFLCLGTWITWVFGPLGFA